MTSELNQQTVQRFNENSDAVSRLMEFDNVILAFAKRALQSAQQKIKDYHPNPLLTKEIDNTLKQFQTIHENQSFRHQYERINNQCLVLLVSYFALAVESLFKDSLVSALRNLQGDFLKNDPIKVSIDDLRATDFDLKTSIGDLIAKDISFQDMQSIARAFQKYYSVEIVPDRDVNNIVLAQACRHVIVHFGGIVNQKLLGQISKAHPRDLKSSLALDEELGFQRAEVDLVAASMKSYLESLVAKIGDAVDA